MDFRRIKSIHYKSENLWKWIFKRMNREYVILMRKKTKIFLLKEEEEMQVHSIVYETV